MIHHTLTLLGATGSIGDSAVDVVLRHPERFTVAAVAANRNHAKLLALCRRLEPRLAALADVDAAEALARALAAESIPTRVVAGTEGLVEAASLPDVDTVLAAIVGAAGLPATLAAARSGKRILLANKEALVIGGALFMDAVVAGGATLLPIDSEHNAVFQCLPPSYARNPEANGVRRILLTASGGPFHPHPEIDFETVTPEQACAHPNWSMGRKISVDSATMMNKGLEVIEARWLFGLSPSQIEIVVHRQSIVHSLVEYVDGSMLAQLGNPDMRTPIAQALGAPERVTSGSTPLDLALLATLTFEPPDRSRFPCIGLAYEALAADAAAPIALNAANEVAVAAFLDHRARFCDIPITCERVLARRSRARVATLDDALAVDAEARDIAALALHVEPPSRLTPRYREHRRL
ncbi:MAG TPA: 1-deoxy-D-xylulose-5-phosphate reductoisomerase [Casimicrobiaceae bacterium]|nr:1-deoxy-D-xylulose-5-phosphate reductoisomerase [Casimicrobiaceae bacterium]